MRPFRRNKASGKPRLLMGIHPVPTLVTLGNLLCGFGAIVIAMRASNPPETIGMNANDCLRLSGLLIFGGMIFDALDGKVARLTKSTSKFGMEMDSLCDIVSFGVAPAVLVKAMIDKQLGTDQPFPLWDRYVWPMLAIYVCCAALRLARYNVESESGHRNFFFGMPSPGAAGCAASLALLIIPSTHSNTPLALQEPITQLDSLRAAIYWQVLVALPFVMLALGILMVSRVHYPHVGDRLLGGRKSFFHILVLGLLLVLIFLHHEIVLALAFNGFLIYGLLNELRCQIFPSQRPKSWDEATATPATVPPLASVAGPAGSGISAPVEKTEAGAPPLKDSGTMPPV